jgi:hypothetical protein
MKENLILPLTCDADLEDHYKADAEPTSLVAAWLNTRSEFIHEVWSQDSALKEIDFSYSPSEIADEIAKILTHRVFNYQSKINLSQIISKVRQNLFRQISNGTTIKLFLLYNGGYRASPLPNQLSLIFEPDQTELMLLFQISLLNKKIFALYNFGIEFNIVINNGVAKWVNDIPITATENYANQLRKMIKFFGAENSVNVLLQSELVGFNPSFSFEPLQQQSLLLENEHLMVERFLGRRCNREEAAHRSALYKLAESKWAEDLSTITTAKDGIIMRQVAHPNMLSFRPFPGGAIRVQNGTFGFQYQKNSLRPKLITSKSMKEHDVEWAPCYFPWNTNKKNLNTNESSKA